MNFIHRQLDLVHQKIHKPAHLLVVSKTRTVEEIKVAYDYGQRDFGENRVQELYEKSLSLADLAINWHFIGTLQTNKVNKLLAVKHLCSIHSIDSLNLLEKILKKKPERKIGLFLQINTSMEKEKSGFAPASPELEQAVKLILNSQGPFYFQGLMTIGKIRTDQFERDAHECFGQLEELKKKLDLDHSLNLELSMGMSQDFEIAQEYGANWLRIGSFIFGPRG
ncbi:MAG: YggS family pyridoxal phosphate-dependent enzyme [Halobacteriovoraceae bacterium]|nr:YggS family pyridoxal phosphate-dependent enzyme [Halobacteriovoraceae bacterium]|tara:strand:- start:535 stop:1203 length:669 start_codon:yes stop_codon:yes gene_type:complete